MTDPFIELLVSAPPQVSIPLVSWVSAPDPIRIALWAESTRIQYDWLNELMDSWKLLPFTILEQPLELESPKPEQLEILETGSAKTILWGSKYPFNTVQMGKLALPIKLIQSPYYNLTATPEQWLESYNRLIFSPIPNTFSTMEMLDIMGKNCGESITQSLVSVQLGWLRFKNHYHDSLSAANVVSPKHPFWSCENPVVQFTLAQNWYNKVHSLEPADRWFRYLVDLVRGDPSLLYPDFSIPLEEQNALGFWSPLSLVISKSGIERTFRDLGLQYDVNVLYPLVVPDLYGDVLTDVYSDQFGWFKGAVLDERRSERMAEMIQDYNRTIYK